MVVAVLAQQVDGDKPLVVVLPRMHDVDEFADDVYNFLGEVPAIFPAWESWPPDGSAADAVGGARLRVLRTLASDKPPRVIVTSGPALMQPVPSREEIAASSRVLRVGKDVDVEELLRWLIERGFERVPAVELPGEVSVHGGIVDIFPTDSEDPLRLEFFGDELESLRRFDAAYLEFYPYLASYLQLANLSGRAVLGGDDVVVNVLVAGAHRIRLDVDARR